MTLVRQPFWPSLAAAAALHAAFFAWVATRPPPRLPQRRPPTTVRLVTRQQPAPPPPARPPPQEAPREVPRRAKLVEVARPPPTAPAPPPTAPPPQAAPPAPRRFAVSMSATSPGGGVAVPTTAGATAARGDPTLPASAPVGDNTAFATARPAPPADVTEVEQLPQVLRQPSALDLRALYPEAARRDGLEGDVRLELLVDERGEVAEVRVLERAGHGFDEVAPEAARRILFRPARRGGRPVAVRIAYTLKFRLAG